MIMNGLYAFKSDNISAYQGVCESNALTPIYKSGDNEYSEVTEYLTGKISVMPVYNSMRSMWYCVYSGTSIASANSFPYLLSNSIFIIPTRTATIAYQANSTWFPERILNPVQIDYTGYYYEVIPNNYDSKNIKLVVNPLGGKIKKETLSIKGQVVSKYNRPVSGVYVNCLSLGTSMLTSAVTGSDGKFTINLPRYTDGVYHNWMNFLYITSSSSNIDEIRNLNNVIGMLPLIPLDNNYWYTTNQLYTPVCILPD